MKTVKQIDEWFNTECRDALNEIPKGIIDMASRNRDTVLIIAQSIARKKCFKVKAVLAYLDSLI